MNQSSRGAMYLCQQLPLDLLQRSRSAKHTSLAVSVTCAVAHISAASVMRLHRYCAYGTGRYGVCYSARVVDPRSSINTALRRIARCGIWNTLQ